MKVEEVMLHVKYFAVGVATLAAIGGLFWLLVNYAEVILATILVLLTYVCGRGICGGYKSLELGDE